MREHFLHYKSTGNIFAWIRTRPRFYGCPEYLQVWWRYDQQVDQEGNNPSSEDQLAQGIDIIWNGGIAETTWTETKTGFYITKTSYKKIVWHSMALNCETNSPIQLKFEFHWDFMPVLVSSKFEEDMIENKHNFFPPLKGM